MSESLSNSLTVERRGRRSRWFAAALALLALAGVFLLPQSVRNPVLGALGFSLGIYNLVVVVAALRARGTAGGVIVDLGALPMRALAQVGWWLGLVVVAGGVWTLARAGRPDLVDVAMLFYFATFVAQAGVTRTGRLQLREKGVLLGTGLIPWANIRGHRWLDECTVALEGDFPWIVHGEPVLPLDEHDPPREAVDAVLAREIARAHGDPSKL